MRKMKLLSLLLVICVFILSSCSGSKLPIERSKSVKNDEIKFSDFDWLTEKKDIEKKFDSEHGANTYVVNKEESYDSDHITDKLMIFRYKYQGKDDEALMWDVAGEALEYITLEFISADNGKTNYLVSGKYTFKDGIGVIRPNEIFDELVEKLKNKYNLVEIERNGTDYNYYNHHALFDDKNGNQINLKLYQEIGWNYNIVNLTLTYACKEAEEIIASEKEKYQNNSAEKTNGL